MKKYDGVMQRVRNIEDKYGIKYAKTDGKLYKALNVMYILSAIWALVMNLFFSLGVWLRYSGTGSNELFNPLITVCICSGVIILGYILNRFKLFEIGGALSVLSCAFTVLTFAPLLKDSLGLWGFNYSFYWRHLAPNALMIIFMVWMTVLAVRARIKTNKQYKKVTENLFAQYKTQDLTDEQWDEFLRSYTPYEKMAVTSDER